MQLFRHSRPLAALIVLAACVAGAPARAERTQSANLVPVAELSSPPEAEANWPRGVRSDLLLANDGNVYMGSGFGGEGTGAIARLTPDGDLTTIYSLKDDGSEGVSMYGALMQGTDGALYGTTYIGGGEGGGTLFRVTLAGTFTVLHEFGGGDPNPIFPYTGVTQGPDGLLYGTTYQGGDDNTGTVWRIATDGTGFTVLHDFRGNNGSHPEGRLVVGADNMLYGTTMTGGDDNRGIIYRISTAGNFEELYSFPRLGQFNNEGLATNSTGANPRAGLLRSSLDGNFYGTAFQGGEHGYGTVFRLTPAGELSVVHAFRGPLFGGGAPLSTLTQDAAGNLYGTTSGGSYRLQGSAYRLAPDGTFTLLHGFIGAPIDGVRPYAGILPAHGTLYGASSQTTIDGGGAGVIFKLDEGGGGVPPVDLQISANDILMSEAVTLTWNAPAGHSCQKLGGVAGWEGATTPSGTQNFTPFPGTYTFALSCTQPDDGNAATPAVVRTSIAALNVRAPTLDPVDGGGGTGTLSLWWLLLAAALLGSKLNKEFRSPCP